MSQKKKTIKNKYKIEKNPKAKDSTLVTKKSMDGNERERERERERPIP